MWPQFKCRLFFPLNLFPRRLRAVSLWAKRETRKWSCARLMARDGRGTKKKSSLSFFFAGCALVSRVSRLRRSRARAFLWRKRQTGWREETRSGTERRCSHNLQSGHPARWSADNCSTFPTVNIIEKIISCIFVFLVIVFVFRYWICGWNRVRSQATTMRSIDL